MNNDQNSQFEHDDHGSKTSENSYSYVFSNGMAPTPPPPKKTPVRGKWIAIVSAAVCLCILFSFGAGFLGARFAASLGAQTNDNPTDAPEETSDPAELLNQNPEDELEKSASAFSVYGSAGEDVFSASSVARMVQDSVVVIEAVYSSSMGYNTSSSSGSGVIISQSGYILTCNHVVENAQKIQVTLRSGSVYTASLVGDDAASDLAVIKIEPRDEEPLTYVEQGCSGDLVVGESVIAIGNPLGIGLTVTTGVVSATERNITMSDGVEMTLIQTDAAINSGNSGGGLFNLDGQLIGIVNAKYSASGVEGLAFAIPIDSAYHVEKELMQYGYVRGVVDHGLELFDVTEQNLYQAYFLYNIQTVGVYIYSSEYHAELQPLDRILELDGKSVSSASAFEKMIKEHKVGDTVTVKVLRSAKTANKTAQEITVTLELQEYVPDRLKETDN